MEKQNIDVYETPDLSFAAYLKMKGLKLIDVGRIVDNGKRFKFIFDDNAGDAEDLRMEFINSESYQFDLSAKTLRSMIKNSKI